MKPIKRAISLCWLMLVACFLIKLFGGNWFEVVCTNEHFVNVCNFIDNNKIAYYLVGAIMYVASTSWIIMACSKITEPTNKELVVIFSSLIVVWASQFISITIKTVLEIANTLFMPIFLNMLNSKFAEKAKTIKRTWYFGIIGYILVFIFQLMSLLTRNVGIKYTHDSTLTTLILMIDYYIMIVMYYLYVKKSKEDKKDG